MNYRKITVILFVLAVVSCFFLPKSIFRYLPLLFIILGPMSNFILHYYSIIRLVKYSNQNHPTLMDVFDPRNPLRHQMFVMMEKEKFTILGDPKLIALRKESVLYLNMSLYAFLLLVALSIFVVLYTPGT